MMVKKAFCALSFLFMFNTVNAQTDSVFIKYKPVDRNHSFTYYHDVRDSSSVEFPFMESVIYNFEVDDKHFKLWFTTKPLDKENAPFAYSELDSTYLAEKEWIDNRWVMKAPLLDIIQRFRNKELVIMLYDTTQPSDETHYVVRVYFSYEGYE
ncbi:MAG: hypothetical protein WBH03_17955 [Cyclobacteriaceae bacterium]